MRYILEIEIGYNRTRWISENDAKVSGFMMRPITIIIPGCFKKKSLRYMKNFKAFAEDAKDVRTAKK